jgi:hypothetical protein
MEGPGRENSLTSPTASLANSLIPCTSDECLKQ